MVSHKGSAGLDVFAVSTVFFGARAEKHLALRGCLMYIVRGKTKQNTQKKRVEKERAWFTTLDAVVPVNHGNFATGE